MKTRDPMARDLKTAKYRPQVVRRIPMDRYAQLDSRLHGMIAAQNYLDKKDWERFYRRQKIEDFLVGVGAGCAVILFVILLLA